MNKRLKRILDECERSIDTFRRDENLRSPQDKAARCVVNISPCEHRRKSSDNTCQHYPDPE